MKFIKEMAKMDVKPKFSKQNFDDKKKYTKPAIKDSKKASESTYKQASSFDKSKKTVKRLSRNDLIAEKEKLKMKHKFNKIMRKDHNPKLRQNRNPESSLEIALKKESDLKKYQKMDEQEKSDNKRKFKRDPKKFTVKKRAVEEYEKKMKEKEIEKEVICLLFK